MRRSMQILRRRYLNVRERPTRAGLEARPARLSRLPGSLGARELGPGHRGRDLGLVERSGRHPWKDAGRLSGPPRECCRAGALGARVARSLAHWLCGSFRLPHGHGSAHLRGKRGERGLLDGCERAHEQPLGAPASARAGDGDGRGGRERSNGGKSEQKRRQLERRGGERSGEVHLGRSATYAGLHTVVNKSPPFKIDRRDAIKSTSLVTNILATRFGIRH